MDPSESLPPPPSAIPSNVVPMKAASLKTYERVDKKLVTNRLPMARRGNGTKGQKIQLLTNHFRVGMGKNDGFFYHYSVALMYEDGRPVEAMGIGRKVIDKISETYDELQSKNFAYDGEKSLFTIGALPDKKLNFTAVLDEVTSKRVGSDGSPENYNEGKDKRMRRVSQSKTFKVEISYAAKIPLQAIPNALRGQDSEHFQEAVRVLDIILRQHASKKGCLLVRQSFFHDNPRNYTDIGGGVLSCRGFHSSFRATQGGLSLNIDVSNTMILKPGSVVDFLCENQNVRHPNMIDWVKAKRMLKNLRIKANNIEYKITGLSDSTCRNQIFSLKQGKDSNGDVQTIEITVYEYFKRHKKLDMDKSADFPCINVGKPKRPSYFPVELCTLVSLQRYTKALTNLQRAQLVEKSRQKPNERKAALIDSLRNSRYENEPMLRSCGITIEPDFTRIDGRVLQPPRLRVGNGEDFVPRNGRWNFNNKKLVDPVKIERWAIVNFSGRCDTRYLCDTLKKCAANKGIFISPPFRVFEEDNRSARDPAPVRVEKMFGTVKSMLPGPPQLLLCILPQRKNSDIYGPWKRRSLAEEGVATQCIAPTKINDQYITNVLLKVNAKLGGMNSFLSVEPSHSIPLVSSVPTLIIGMDVSHGSPGRSDVPSIAAVVSSRCWPLISRYRAAVRTQSSRVEMIQSLFKPVSDTADEGIMRELLLDFEITSGKRKPQHIIIFRDGVSESQFNQVLNHELNDMIKACEHLDESWSPKFTVIIAQKNHHTKFFQANSPENVPPGTVIDNKICHPHNNDFYMCAQAGMIGTTRPTHYHVLHDEIGFSADDLQELVHSLSYVYQRSTTAISVVAPVCYAHLAAAQMGQFMKFDEFSETSSSHGGMTSIGVPQVPQLPLLHEDVTNSMFFC
ncbi:putative post-transcriptional gene silencing PAZ-Argonaute family [Lupinus albus]|uniref:Putative post-transcriptional gene silencing PAZ-Argonaute family n=1 Tax=Lupinus albus TaxID=3870 RepID=A0A6A4NXC3_LUPAL|nr:putative post-transcriptional gene silencing PAZ-Argonaute family [Lupinus albus]